MDREKLLRIRAKCKKFFVYMKIMSLIVLTFLYLQNQFFEADISSSLIVPKINAVAGIFQILLFTFFIYFEEGSVAALKHNVNKHIFQDMKTTFKMSIPSIFLILHSEFFLVASKILPYQSASAGNYSIIGVAIFTVLVLKKRFFLSQATAICFIAKGLDQFPLEQVRIDVAGAANDSLITFYGHFSIVLAILCYGLSYVILEKVLKSSDVSLWIRGIQLNLFTVPLSLLVSYSNDWLNEGPQAGFFDSFNIIAWFFIVFKIAQQMMELFVIKVADSLYRCIALSTALVVIGVMKHPFSFEVLAAESPVKLGTGLVFAGTCLYIILDNCGWNKWSEDPEVESDEEYRESPVDYNETLAKGYQTVQTVSSTVSNADAFVNLIDEQTRES